jgi:RecA-family ATPase
MSTRDYRDLIGDPDLAGLIAETNGHVDLGPGLPSPRDATEIQAANVDYAPPLLSVPNDPSDALLRSGERLVIGAIPGRGKSTFSYAMAWAIATGSEFLGWRGAGLPVLYLDGEQSTRSIQNKLFGRSLTSGQLTVIEAEGVSIALGAPSKARDDLASALSSGEYAAVFIDPMLKLLGGIDPHHPVEVDQALTMLDGWRKEAGTSLVIPHHLRKTKERPHLTDLLGSQTFGSWPERAIGLYSKEAEATDEMYPDPNVAESELVFLKDREGSLGAHRPPRRLLYHLKRNEYKWKGGSTSAQPRTPSISDVL